MIASRIFSTQWLHVKRAFSTLNLNNKKLFKITISSLLYQEKLLNIGTLSIKMKSV